MPINPSALGYASMFVASVIVPTIVVPIGLKKAGIYDRKEKDLAARVAALQPAHTTLRLVK